MCQWLGICEKETKMGRSTEHNAQFYNGNKFHKWTSYTVAQDRQCGTNLSLLAAMSDGNRHGKTKI
jgi:hypothetical protein